MEKNEIVVGLDIGTTKIAVIVGKRNELGKLEILGSGKAESIGVKRGVVSNIENTVQSIQTAVHEAAQRSRVTIASVHVGIAGQHIKSLQHKGHLIRNSSEEEISQEEIDKLTENMFKLAMNPGEEIIDVIPQEYTIDGDPGIPEPKGMLGSKLEADFHIILGQTTAAKNIYKCVRKAGIQVESLLLEPLASAEAVLSDEEKEAGVALVDIGGGTTDIAIFKDGIVRHTAVIPFGGEIITEDVKEGCNIVKKHAEELKVKFGSALSSENRDTDVVAIPGLRGRPPKEITLKNLSSIIQARMEEIIENIYFEIQRSGLEKKLIAGIVLTGGGAQLKHLVQLTMFKTGMDTRVGYPNEHLAKDVPEEMASPMYATGIGLVIIGLARLEKLHEKERKFEKPEIAEKAEDPKTKKKREGFEPKFTFFEKIKKLLDSDDID
ncbi:MAG: cell division protein FtsA [Bacteroidales bacterium]